MSDEALVVVIGKRVVGIVERQARGRLRFRYDDDWRGDDGSYPLSLSMPLATAVHDDEAIDAFLRGLLPDSDVVLERWARRYQVSPRNAFQLLSHIGEECAGAAQFVRPERVAKITSGLAEAIHWLEPSAIAGRLRDLRADHAASRYRSDPGQFSLAGAQPKTAFARLDGRYGVPVGRTPTTHILKPPSGEFAGLAENEHVCLSLARELGIPAARSEVVAFEDEITIVVERYDRRIRSAERDSGDDNTGMGFAIDRLHQEDVWQALGYRPERKYQSSGGPTPATIARSSEIIRRRRIATSRRSSMRWLSTGSSREPMPMRRTIHCCTRPAHDCDSHRSTTWRASCPTMTIRNARSWR